MPDSMNFSYSSNSWHTRHNGENDAEGSSRRERLKGKVHEVGHSAKDNFTSVIGRGDEPRNTEESFPRAPCYPLATGSGERERQKAEKDRQKQEKARQKDEEKARKALEEQEKKERKRREAEEKKERKRREGEERREEERRGTY